MTQVRGLVPDPQDSHEIHYLGSRRHPFCVREVVAAKQLEGAARIGFTLCSTPVAVRVDAAAQTYLVRG